MKSIPSIKIACCVLCIVYISANSITEKNTDNTTWIVQDSIALWLQAARDKSYNQVQQKAFLHKAHTFLQSKTNDASKAKALSTIAYRYYQLKDTTSFQNINKKTLILATQLKDSFIIADAHWSYADYYLNGELYEQAYEHFTIAYNHFNGIQKEYETARMLYAMGFIKGRYRDYNGSEVLFFKAIEKFKKLNNNKYLYDSYNQLGLLQNDIQEYDRALFYHQKALEYLEKVANKKNNYAISLNNIGITYMKKGEYRKAIDYFNKGLVNNIEVENYARLIENRAYSRLMLGDTLHIKKDMLRALYIRDSINNRAAVMKSKIRLGEYYTFIKDTTTAFRYAQEANTLALRIKNGRDYLESLDLMAKLDPGNAQHYLRRHIQYNDSLITVERKVQNKFTRIAFETDEYIAETKRLSEQRIWLIITGFGALLILSLLYFLRIQRTKTEKLLLETEQQKANEQVYLLTIQQQTVLEEEKIKERNRISEELHDGILSRLFGTRVGLGFLEVKGDTAAREQQQSFLTELQEIEKDIRDVSHQLHSTFENVEVNFTNIVEQLLQDKSDQGGFAFQFEVDKNIAWKQISEIIKVNVYRIVQEALQNIVKHAAAKQVSVSFSLNNAILVCIIEDDGKGFIMTKRSSGIGIKNIRSRVKKMKGTLRFSPETGSGTSIHIHIPISNS